VIAAQLTQILTLLGAFLIAFVLGCFMSPLFVRMTRVRKTMFVRIDRRTNQLRIEWDVPKNGMVKLGPDGDRKPIPLDGNFSLGAGANRAFLVNFGKGHVFLPNDDPLAPDDQPGPEVLREALWSVSERKVNEATPAGWKEILASFTPLIAIATLVTVIIMAISMWKTGSV
jgi:hypothetical protein